MTYLTQEQKDRIGELAQQIKNFEEINDWESAHNLDDKLMDLVWVDGILALLQELKDLRFRMDGLEQ